MKYLAPTVIGIALIATQSTAIEPEQKTLFSLGGISVSGYADLSYYDDETSSGSFARAELDFAYAPNRQASAFSLGFSLGFDGAKEGGSGTISAGVFYPAAVIEFGENHKVSLGAPRSVMNRGYIPTTVFALNSRLDLILSPVTDSMVSYLALAGDYHPYGIRYDTAIGQTRVGASYNQINDSGLNADFYALAFSRNLAASGRRPELDFFGGIEHISSAGVRENNYTIGLEASFEKLDIGLRFNERNMPVNTLATEIYGRMQFNHALSSSASVINIDGSGSNTTIYGISVEYQFVNDTHINAGVSDGNNGTPRMLDLSVGWRF